jgi:hypothetical protein
MLIVTLTRRGYMPPGRSGQPELDRRCMGCVAHRILEIGRGYARQVRGIGGDRRARRERLRAE